MLEGGDASGDRWATAMNAELSSTMNGGGFGRSSRELYSAGAGMSFMDEPAASFDEETWGVLASMGNTPTKRAHGGSGLAFGGGASGRGYTERAATPGSTSGSSASGPLSSGRGGQTFTFDDLDTGSATSSSAGSASHASASSNRPNRAIRHNSSSDAQILSPWTPRAKALSEINDDFKAGRITEKEKAIRKQKLIDNME